MSKNTFHTIIVLTLVWITLIEDFSIGTAATGIAISTISVYIYSRFLPFPKIENIIVFRFIIYLFYLFGQVFVCGFTAIKLILTGADVDIVEIKTNVSNGFLRSILANSFTLTPGSVSLELKDDKISLLWLKGKNDSHQDAVEAAELLKVKLEKKLLKSQG